MTTMRELMMIVESGGSPLHTDTPEFKAWFKNSKLVDNQGRPLRLYHGTTKQFDAFDRKMAPEGFFFTNRPEQASHYADEEGGRILPVFVSIQKPAPFKEYMAAAKRSWTEAAHEMQQRGYDGVIMRDDGLINAIVFEPQQVKSAVGNSGAFDASKTSIHETRRPAQTVQPASRSRKLPRPGETVRLLE